jgi:tetraacyldisaccharide 4'-kinase
MTRIQTYLEPFRRRIETAAKGNDSAPFFSLETALLIVSVMYGGLVRFRARLYEKGLLPSKALPCRVVSIGNLIAGGTGKTPMTIMVAQRIRDLGYRVVVVSRGYRGRMESAGGIVSDGATIFKSPDDAGDEPYLMARILKGIPVVVGKDRYAAGLLAVRRFNPDVIVLDDAFQHLRLKRDLDLVLLDSRLPLANGHLLPRGLLREPVAALRRAHAVIFTRSNPALRPSIPDALAGRRPVFHTMHVPVIRNTRQAGGALVTETMDIACLKGKKTVAFAGLADNAQFFDSLERAGCNLVGQFSFADHHRYRRDELDRIAEAARTTGADVIATPFKDFVKIENDNPWPVKLVAVDVNLQLTHAEDSYLSMLSTALQV